MTGQTPDNAVPIGEGFFALPSSPSEKPHLLGSKCRSCGEVFFPTRVCCRACTGSELDTVALSRTGKLYAFTTVRVKPPHFVGKVPYMVGIIELPEGERVKAQLTDCDQSSLKIGMEMELVIESVGKCLEPAGNIKVGQEILGWKFRPAGRQP